MKKIRDWLVKAGVYALFIFISIRLMELYGKRKLPLSWRTGDREAWFATKIQIVGFGIVLPIIAVLHALILLMPLIVLVLIVRSLRRSDTVFALFAAACALLLPVIFWIRSLYTGANSHDAPMIASVSFYLESMFLLGGVICLFKSWWSVRYEIEASERTFVPWVSSVLVIIGFATWGMLIVKNFL